MSSPNITFMLQYTGANSQFVDYTNRKEAVDIQNEMNETQKELLKELGQEKVDQILSDVPEQSLNFTEYINYMNRSYATEKQTKELTAVFNQDKNHLSVDEVNQLKKNLERAYENGSLLWQGVVSFDNEFLAEQGLYDLATGQVDQAAIKNVLREAMPHLIQREGLSDDAFWWGNIHLNTDNIHIHFGLSELHSNREKIFYQPRGRMEYKGNFSQKSIKGLKSEIFHGLLNDQTRSQLLRQEQVLVNLKTDLLKNVLVDHQVSRPAEKKFLEQAYNHLPQDRQWSFKSNAKDFAVSKFFINRYLDSYFENEGKEVYQDFLSETRDFLENYRQAYSTEKNQAYEKVRYVDGQAVKTEAHSKGFDVDKLVKKREQELRERLGNTILKQFKEGVPTLQSDSNIESNLHRFSPGNRKRLLEQNPDISVVNDSKAWEKQGYKVREGEKPYTILKPIYQEYDKDGTGKGSIIGYNKVPVYDISQVESNINDKQLSMKDLSYFSADQLSELIDAARKKEDLSEKERKELGLYRYALFQKNVEIEQTRLKVLSKVADQFKALPQDQPYLDFKKRELNNRLRLNQLQLKPNYQLSTAEKKEKQMLSTLYIEPEKLSIKLASSQKINPSLNRLDQEMKLVSQVRDPHLISLFSNEVTKEDSILALKARKNILEVKNDIYQNNKKLKASEDNENQELKVINAKKFQDLKRLYSVLDKSNTNEKDNSRMNQLKQQVSNTMQKDQQARRANLQRNHGAMKATDDFMSGLSAVLKASSKENINALKSRDRQRRREEEEEHSQQL